MAGSIFINTPKGAQPPAITPEAEAKAASTTKLVSALHKTLPSYAETPLRTLPALAADLGVAQVLLKDESNRFGLPSFKVLGASWAVYRAIARRVGVPINPGSTTTSPPADLPSLASLGSKARAAGLEIITCSEGNWGRAVARMGKTLGVQVTVYVSDLMVEYTRQKMREEGAELVVVEGGYDAAAARCQSDVVAAQQETEGGPEASTKILLSDAAVPGFEEVPSWAVEGYETMLVEADGQVAEVTGRGGEGRYRYATHAVVPVGAGSIAQAVTQWFKSPARARAGDDDDDDDGGKTRAATRVLTVEPVGAACLQTALREGTSRLVETGKSIMAGMNCGEVSSTAWPVLRAGVDAAVTVTDREAHEAVVELRGEGMEVGPCGAATVAALRRVAGDAQARGELGLGEESVVVVFCTEGTREYEAPL